MYLSLKSQDCCRFPPRLCDGREGGGGVKAFIWSEPNNEILFCCVYKRVMGQKENKHGKVSDPLYSVRTVILCQVTGRHWPN